MIDPNNLTAHEAAMIAKADASGAENIDRSAPPPAEPAATLPIRPDDVPEKFWDAATGTVRHADLLKSYIELEKSRGAPAAPVVPSAPLAAAGITPDTVRVAKDAVVAAEAASVAAAAKVVAEPENAEAKAAADLALAAVATAKTAAEKADADAAAALAAAARPNPDTLREQATAELAAGGVISDATYQGYEKLGITREQIDTYVAGQQAQGQLRLYELADAVGGKDKYQSMIDWARAGGVDQASAEAFDAAIRADSATANTAAAGLFAKYVAANGSDGTLQAGGGGGPSSGGYVNKGELTKAMSDPRYRTDPQYRAEVARKTEAGLRAGNELGV